MQAHRLFLYFGLRGLRDNDGWPWLDDGRWDLGDWHRPDDNRLNPRSCFEGAGDGTKSLDGDTGFRRKNRGGWADNGFWLGFGYWFRFGLDDDPLDGTNSPDCFDCSNDTRNFGSEGACLFAFSLEVSKPLLEKFKFCFG